MLSFLKTKTKPGAGMPAPKGRTAALFAEEDRLDPNRDPKRLPGLTAAERHKMAWRPPSFVDLLPWIECDANGVFLLEDGVSRGVMYELDPIPTEASSKAYLAERMREVQSALSVLPEYDDAPWVVQFFVNDDTGLDALVSEFRAYVRSSNTPERAEMILNSAPTKSFIEELESHLKVISKPGGCFVDEAVSGNVWRGQIRRARMAVYRRFPLDYDFSKEAFSPLEQLEQAAAGIVAGLRQSGVREHRMLAEDFYNWMLPFFNPRPYGDLATSVSEILKICPYPGEDASERPFGVDLSDLLLLSPPRSDPKSGLWYFNDMPMRALALQNLRKNPLPGHFTAEREHADKHYARFDQMPPGTMLSFTMVVTPQDTVHARVQGIRDASRAKTSEAELTHAEASDVLAWKTRGDKLYPCFTVLYVRGKDEQDLRNKAAEINSTMGNAGLRFVDPRHELIGCDVFMRGLPMNFDSMFDEREMRRGRLTWVSQIASMVPVYGRARGTGHPGFMFWNRGGEPLWVDPLNKKDRKKNGHLLMLGPTGAGKSATLNYLFMLMMAIYRPRLVIVDAGKSFGLLTKYFESMGLSIFSLELTPNADVSLPPFANAGILLEDVENEAELIARMERADAAQVEPDEEDDDTEANEEKRDLLGEMTIAARLMITGGEASEEAKMGRADRYLIAEAILAAARSARAAGHPHPRSEDVARALLDMRSSSELGAARQARAEDMGQAMLVFCKGLRGELFNRYGTAWPDADVTLVEMGTLAGEGYEDALSVAYTSLINHVQATAERTHYEGRPIIFATDEGHIITKNPLLSPYVVKITKMWRKLGCWFWLGTQSLGGDFPDEARGMLSMCEWWILLTMDRGEIDSVSRFRTLTAEQRVLMESATKEPPKYTEGVILASAVQALFRNVPPALPIALAMTEQHEKAARKEIMNANGCSELEAAYEIARRLTAKRG